MSDFFVHPSAEVDHGAQIGAHTKIWHFCHVMPRAFIGHRVILGQNCFVANGVIIGDGCKIQNNVSLYEGVILEDDVFVGPSVVFTNVINPRAHVERKSEYQKTPILKGASIGANATVICGNKIGAYALVGAGSVVNRDVKDFEKVVGNPIRHIGWVSKAGHPLHFNNNKAQCPQEGTMYIINDQEQVSVDG